MYIFITIQYISTKLYTKLVLEQSGLSNYTGKILTFGLLQGHRIQYGPQTLFQSAKISM